MEGTLKYNIDPLNHYEEREIIDLLKEVGLSSLYESNEKKLEMLVFNIIIR